MRGLVGIHFLSLLSASQFSPVSNEREPDAQFQDGECDKPINLALSWMPRFARDSGEAQGRKHENEDADGICKLTPEADHQPFGAPRGQVCEQSEFHLNSTIKSVEFTFAGGTESFRRRVSLLARPIAGSSCAQVVGSQGATAGFSSAVCCPHFPERHGLMAGWVSGRYREAWRATPLLTASVAVARIVPYLANAPHFP